MVFVHPNPMDSTCWLFQTAHFSTWYRCVAVDLPGYGRSPTARAGLTMPEVAAACWEAVDRAGADGPAVLVGCSVGSSVVQHMYHLRPEATAALVLSGASYRPVKEFARKRGRAFSDQGLRYRREYAYECLSADFARNPLAEWLVTSLMERETLADLDSIVTLFEAMSEPDPAWLQADLDAPVLIVSGSRDQSHEGAFALRDRLPKVDMITLEGAGHACFLEQPWAFDQAVIAFLSSLGHEFSARR
jgi:pimeloyl-ACP methyl ester carboxylesterase